MSKIEWNLRMLGRLEPEKTRLFFLGENAFVLSFEQLSKIIEMTHTFMPNIREFSMYARIDDVLRKTPEELKKLRENGDLRSSHRCRVRQRSYPSNDEQRCFLL